MTQAKTVKIPKIPAGYGSIAEKAKAYKAAQQALRERVERIQQARRKAGSRLKPGLLTRIEAAKAARIELQAAIEAEPGLWSKPRTRNLHGVKVGRRTLPGTLEIDGPTAVLAIRELMPEREKDLVSVKTSLVKSAVKKLSGAELAAIGGRIVELGDETVISIPKDDVDSLVEALLKGFEDPNSEEAA